MFIYRLLSTNASVSEKLIVALASLIAIVFSIVMHEVSHGYVAKLNGDLTAKSAGRLTLNPVVHFDLMGIVMMMLVGFGWAKPVPINPLNFKNRKVGMITVTLSGVVTNLLLAGLSLLLLYLLAPVLFAASPNRAFIVLRTLGLYLLIYMITINFMLAMFNLLPIYPLDGFNLINTFLPHGNPFTRFMVRYGFFVLIGLILLGQVGDMLNLPFLNIFARFYDLVYSLIEKTLLARLAGV